MTPKKLRLWFALFALATLAMVLVNLRLRLAPFDFVWDGRVPWERITLGPLTFRDVPLNVLLFAPLGFALAGLWALRPGAAGSRRPADEEARGWRAAVSHRPSTMAFVLLTSLAFATALEAAQLFLPERVPSLTDVVADGLGALLGYALFRAWAMGFGRALRRYVTARSLLLALALYLAAAALFTAYLYRRAHLSNWDTSYRLVIGNEAVGRRQWSGRVQWLEFDLYSGDSLVTSGVYRFAGDAPFADMAQGSNLPALNWREGPASEQTGDGVTVGPGEWLATDGPFGTFSTAARQSNRFALRAGIATAARDQRGPARIVSISADAEHRNVTLGQVGDNLIIRLRTPAAGENGQKPEVLVPGVFADTRQRTIGVSYRAPLLRVTVDDRSYALSLAPGAAFFPDFTTENRYQIVMGGDPHRYDWPYWGIVVGLAALLCGVPAAARLLLAMRDRRGTTDH